MSSYIFEESLNQNFTKQRHKFVYICTRAQRLGEGISYQVYHRDGCNGKTSNNEHDWTSVTYLNVLHQTEHKAVATLFS